MIYTGKVFEKVDSEIANIEVEETAVHKIVSIFVGGVLVVKFPLFKDIDSNEVALRTGNVVNQTGLVDNPVRIEITETE
ncbi:unnamed protein product [marine sediment metagenome]|uniref:Uncharacterized protein n=1 Tax=marine sediment metagenome TaxID=412755 RepID=X1UY19_9ZZZZ